MTRTDFNFAISGPDGSRAWLVPAARTENLAINPLLTGADLAKHHHPVAILGLLQGAQLCGTALSQVTIGGVDFVHVDLWPTVIYRHNVRNVRTYLAGVEDTWGVIDIGDPIYFDRSATMPAGVFLSTSPLDNTGAPNPLWGWAVFAHDITMPTLVATAATTDIAIQQAGTAAPSPTVAAPAPLSILESMIAAGAVTVTKIGAGAVTGDKIGLLANDSLVGGAPLLFPIAIPGGAAASKSLVLATKVRVIDAWVQMNAAGEAGDTTTVEWNDGVNPAVPITDAMATGSALDTAIVRAAKVDDAAAVIDAGESLQVTTTDADTGDDVPAMTVYVLAMPVA